RHSMPAVSADGSTVSRVLDGIRGACPPLLCRLQKSDFAIFPARHLRIARIGPSQQAASQASRSLPIIPAKRGAQYSLYTPAVVEIGGAALLARADRCGFRLHKKATPSTSLLHRVRFRRERSSLRPDFGEPWGILPGFRPAGA